MSTVIELDEVRYDVEDVTGRLALSLSVDAGDSVVLLGPARCGKGLVLRLCAGLLVPDEGTVRVLGQDPAAPDGDQGLELRLRMGAVLQPPGLLSNMTVFNNVALPLRYHSGRDDEDIEAMVMPLLARLGLASIRARFPSTLIFGEAKIVALARALVMEPEVLLLEEPAAGLDAESLARVGAVLQEERARRPLTLLATLSQPSRLQDVADRVIYMRNGKVVAAGRRTDLLGSATGDLLAYLGP
jgi:ABC-type transporter Mla maintaining outer membrane lipid asymmetry ATPase subunit MlaF